MQFGLNYKVMGNYSTYYYAGQRNNHTVSDCFSPSMQIMFPLQYAKAGLGIQYQNYMKIFRDNLYATDTEQAGRFSFLPVYLVAQVPIHYRLLPFEIYAEIGYSLLLGNREYRSYSVYDGFAQAYLTHQATLSGSFHTGYGVGLIRGPIAYKIMFQCDHGFYDREAAYKYNVEYYSFGLGMEWRIPFSKDRN